MFAEFTFPGLLFAIVIFFIRCKNKRKTAQISTDTSENQATTSIEKTNDVTINVESTISNQCDIEIFYL